MTDNSFDVNLGIAEVVKEVKDTKTVAEVDTTSALLVRAIHAALSPLEKWVMQKEYNLAATKKLLEAKLQETPVENIITPPSYVAVPALQAISYCMDDDQLRDMFAELLAHAMNTDTVDNVHPTYVEIIKQMSPYDAVVFKKLVKQIVIPCIGIKYVHKESRASYPICDIAVFSNFTKHPLVPTQICLENLERLHLIEINRKSKLNAKNRYQELETSFKELIAQFVEENKSILPPEEYEVAYDEFVIEIRGFGQFFARACLGEDFRNVM
ncbi:MAG: DUF4393 domain-containing protein [Oliverpabstia sp.]